MEVGAPAFGSEVPTEERTERKHSKLKLGEAKNNFRDKLSAQSSNHPCMLHSHLEKSVHVAWSPKEMLKLFSYSAIFYPLCDSKC